MLPRCGCCAGFRESGGLSQEGVSFTEVEVELGGVEFFGGGAEEAFLEFGDDAVLALEFAAQQGVFGLELAEPFGEVPDLFEQFAFHSHLNSRMRAATILLDKLFQIYSGRSYQGLKEAPRRSTPSMRSWSASG